MKRLFLIALLTIAFCNSYAAVTSNRFVCRDSLIDPADTTFIRPGSVRTDSLLANNVFADTFKWLDGTNWAYRGPGTFTYIPLAEYMRIHTDTTTGPVGLSIDAYYNSSTAFAINVEQYGKRANGIYVKHGGLSDGAGNNTAGIRVDCDSSGDGIRVNIKKSLYGGFVAEGPETTTTAGFAAYIDMGTGFYIDHGKGTPPDSNSKAIFVENNNTGSLGYGYYGVNDVGAGNPWLQYLENRQPTARMSMFHQKTPGMPILTLKGDSTGIVDSSLYYWWGMKAKKAEIDTLKTSLAYKKAFGNSAANLRDTILCAGVKTDSTIVAPAYIYDSGASTFNALQYYVRPDTIFTIRQAATDPDSFSIMIMKKK